MEESMVRHERHRRPVCPWRVWFPQLGDTRWKPWAQRLKRVQGESGRYHLYVSLACPWAHRLIVRKLKRLEDVISVSVVDPFMGDKGWALSSPDGSITAGSTADTINHAKYLYEVYLRSEPGYSGRVTTLVRFDSVYYGHFKCNLRRITDYPNLWGYARDLYQTAGVAETVNLAQIKRHYYMSHPTINPTRIVPKGPELDFTISHDRARLTS
jgi:glutathionyl-hydroquinone reductase